MDSAALDNEPEESSASGTGDSSARRRREIQELERMFKLNDVSNRQRLEAQMKVKSAVSVGTTVEAETEAVTEDEIDEGADEKISEEQREDDQEQLERTRDGQDEQPQDDKQTKEKEKPKQEEFEEQTTEDGDEEEEDGEDEPDDDEEDDEDEEVEVPSVVGQDPDSAKQSLEEAGLKSVQDVVGESEEPMVTGSQPSSGEKAKKGDTVTLTVTLPKDDDDEEDEEDEDKDDDEDPEEEPDGEEGDLEGEGVPEGAAGEGAAAGVGAEAGAGAAAGGAEAGAGAVVATSEIWVPALAIIGIIVVTIALLMMIMASVTAYCNQPGVKGWIVRATSNVASWVGAVPLNVCKLLVIKDQPIASGTRSTPFIDESKLVRLSVAGLPVKADADDRVMPCMLAKIQQIYNASRSANPPIEWEITDSYRPGDFTANGTPSAHGRGEAVDLALRNPNEPLRSTNSRIARLIAIARSAGFVPPPGDALDEYKNPAPDATGGHIHLEFNIPTSGSYCDGTANQP